MTERLPRKAPAKRPAVSAVTHTETCAGPRLEAYEARRPDDSLVRIERCQECGAHEAR